MRPPRLCLLCGRLRAEGEDDAAACAGCGEAPPDVTWQSTQSYRPGQRAGIVIACALVGVVLLAVAALFVREALRGPFGGGTLVALALALCLVFFTGVGFWASGYTLFVRTYRFESADGRVFGDISTLAGRVRTAFGLNYVVRPIELPSSARDLTSARAHAADPKALCEQLRAAGSSDPEHAWLGLDDDVVVVLAAILGMAARGEIDVLAGKARRFWIGPRPEHPKDVGDRIWLRPRGGAAAALPFERHFRERLDAIAAGRRSDGSPAPAAYRVGAARDEAPMVELGEVVAGFPMGDPESGDAGAGLRELFAAEAVTVDRDELAAALVAAAMADPRATQALVLDVAETMDAMS